MNGFNGIVQWRNENYMEIKVSVVVPVYNAERFLRPCLDSIRNQTLKEIEIICVDDGSADGSLKILEEYKELDSRIIVLQKKHVAGAGAGAARNMGIEEARGKYLAILDADDFFELDMLESAYRMAVWQQAQLVVHEYNWDYDNSTKKERKVKNTHFFPDALVFSGADVSEHLFQVTRGAAWRILFQRQFIHEKNIRFLENDVFNADDLTFTFLAMSEAERITILNSCFAHHRLNTGTNQSAKGDIVAIYNALRGLKEALEERRVFEVYKCTFLNDAIWRLINSVITQQELQCFEKFYNLLKEEIFYNLELGDYLGLAPGKIYNYNVYYEFKMIMEFSLEKYLFNKNKEIMMVYGYRLPEEIRNSNLDIVLYGGGVYGKCIYGRIFENNICHIVSWIDKNYEKIGFPVQNIDKLENVNYDYILIAIIDEQVVRDVKNMLIHKGIDERKILVLNNIIDEAG